MVTQQSPKLLFGVRVLGGMPNLNFDMNPTKVCTKCKKELPITYFPTKGGSSYKRSECKVCYRNITKNASKVKKHAPLIPNNHICPICLKEEDQIKHLGGKTAGAWCCDHDHSTNTFRGYLCHSCNRMIGGFEEDISKLDRAKEYIISHREKINTEIDIIIPISDFIKEDT